MQYIMQNQGPIPLPPQQPNMRFNTFPQYAAGDYLSNLQMSYNNILNERNELYNRLVELQASSNTQQPTFNSMQLQQLYQMGYTQEQIAQMTPEQILFLQQMMGDYQMQASDKPVSPPKDSHSSERPSPRNNLSDSEPIAFSSSRSSGSSKGMLQHIQEANEEAKKQNVVFSPKKLQSSLSRQSLDQQTSQMKAFNSMSKMSMLHLPSFQNFGNISQMQQIEPKETKDKGVQAADDPIISLCKNSEWEVEVKFQKIKLDRFSHVEEFQIPSKEEHEIFLAHQNALRNQVDDLLKKAAQKEKIYQDAQDIVKQRDQTLSELQQTIKALEQRLKEQRDLFQEKIVGIKNEADRYVDSIKTSKNDIDNLESARNLKDIPDRDNELSNVSIRLVELERKNAQLQIDLQDSQESSKILYKKNKALKEKMEEMENEKRQLAKKYNSEERQLSLKQYCSKVKTRYNDIKKKYEDLQVEYEELKRIKNTRFDPLLMSRVIEKAVDRSTDNSLSDKQLVTRMKNAELRAENLRVRNEEMHLLLGKANHTIDRLNQLLTRKENQLTSFHEQISDLRQQITLLQRKSQ